MANAVGLMNGSVQEKNALFFYNDYRENIWST